MTKSDVSKVDRRRFLGGALAAGAAAALPPGGLSRAMAASPVSLSFEGWNYDPAFQNMIVEEFTRKHPDIKVDFVAEPSAQYVAKMIARFIGNNAPDLMYVRDETLAGWADSGYIRDIEGFDGWRDRIEGLIPFHLKGLQYKGKTWGLPYYGDHIAYIYNADMLEKAGIKTPPVTWAELADQAMAIKKAGIVEYPVIFPLKTNGGLHWWSAVYGSGGSLFETDGTPKFPDEDPTSLKLLEWIVDAAKKGILDPGSVQMGTAETRLAFAAGKAAFISSARYDLKLLNDPKRSKVAGQAKQVLFPSLTEDGPHGTVGWTQMFAISQATKYPDQAWQVLQYISSPEVAKRYYLKDGVGFAYESLNDDPDIKAETAKWSDPAMFVKQGELAKPREYMSFPWASEWETFHFQQMEEAALGRMSARDALQASADKAVELKKSV